MQRKFLLTATLAALLAGSTGLALAQDAARTPTPPATTTQQTGYNWHGHGRMHHRPGMRHHHGMRGRHHGPGAAVISDLRKLSRLYTMQGKASQLPALYNDVLAKTQNPRVRNYVYARLARAQMRPAHVDQAISTLRKSLNENLDRMNVQQKSHKS